MSNYYCNPQSGEHVWVGSNLKSYCVCGMYTRQQYSKIFSGKTKGSWKHISPKKSKTRKEMEG